MSNELRIKSFHAENFKRIKVVDVTFDDTNFVEVTGNNGSGKTSFLDALEATLTGKPSKSTDTPIRNGAKRANTIVDIGEYTVERRWSTNDASTLIVTSKDGKRLTKPQAILDEIIDKHSFNPIGFLSDKNQAESLRRLVGLDCSDLDKVAADAFAERTIVNRRIKSLELETEKLPQHPDIPPDEISLASISEEQHAAQKIKDSNRALRTKAVDARKAKAAAEAKVKELEEKLDAARKALAEADGAAEKAEEIIVGLIDPNLDGFQERMRAGEELNIKIRENKKRNERLAELTRTRREAAALTNRIEDAEGQRNERLASVKYPIDGLRVDADTVLYDDVPFSQASQAKRLEVCLAISEALLSSDGKRRLRFALVRDTPMLDRYTLSRLKEWTEQKAIQLLIELAIDPTEGIGIVFEEGEIWSGGEFDADEVVNTAPDPETDGLPW